MKRLLPAVLILITADLSPAMAGTTAALPVTATVVGDCNITTTPLTFATYDRSTGNTGSASVTANCTKGLNAEITLNGGSSGTRKMSNGTGTLSYTLYKDKALAQEWGTTSGLNIVGTGAADVRTVYGKLMAGQNASPGNYSDTVMATIIFAP